MKLVGADSFNTWDGALAPCFVYLSLLLHISANLEFLHVGN